MREQKINLIFKKYRQKAKISQKDISKLALGSESVATICRFETGQSNPRIDILEKLLKYVGLKQITIENDTAPKTIVVDIDGTISIVGKRKKYLKSDPIDWDSFYRSSFNDKEITYMIDLVNKLAYFYKIVFNTSRSDLVRLQTEEWLDKRFKFDYTLLMRTDGDDRDDIIVKPENLLKNNISLDNILFIIEDDIAMVHKWHSMGIDCFHFVSLNS